MLLPVFFGFLVSFCYEPLYDTNGMQDVHTHLHNVPTALPNTDANIRASLYFIRSPPKNRADPPLEAPRGRPRVGVHDS